MTVTDTSVQAMPVNDRWLRLVWPLAIFSIVLVIIGLILGIRYALVTGETQTILTHQSITPFITAGFAIVGALIATRRPGNIIGWIFLLVAFLYALTLLSAVLHLISSSEVAAWLASWVWVPAVFLPTVFVFMLFPDGRLPSPRWRLVAWLGALGMVLYTLGRALHPGPVDTWSTELNPMGIQALKPQLDLVITLGMVLLVLCIICSIVALIVRFRRSKGLEREQMKWLVYAAGLLVIGFAISAVLTFAWPENRVAGELSIVLSNLPILGIAVASAVAILRYRLYDIDLIINRTLIYGALTAIIVVVYILIVAGLGLLFQSSGNLMIALLATGLVAVLFQPLRERLQGTVNRLMYGERDDPVAVLSKLGQQLEATTTPEATLPGLVETVAQTLKLPYVAIELEHPDGSEIAAAYGLPVEDVTRYPLIYQAETIGYLVVAPRNRGDVFNPADELLLENVARQAGAAAHSVQLTTDLQRSRQRLVTTREEERRRLRRDLHDGLGPTLAAHMLKIGSARALINEDPVAVDQILDGLEADTEATLGEIRRLVYDLRPPELDQLGLVGAIKECAAQYDGHSVLDSETGSNGDGLSVAVEAPEETPALPAAVEVAAYRIVQEGLANVAHHAQATHCQIYLRCDDRPQTQLLLTIRDDGVGLPATHRAGVGLTSMRERAAELGGSCVIEQVTNGGTRVHATLPIVS